MPSMKGSVAVREWIQKDTRPCDLKEFAEFWKVCSPEERKTFAVEACKNLGVELEAS